MADKETQELESQEEIIEEEDFDSAFNDGTTEKSQTEIEEEEVKETEEGAEEETEEGKEAEEEETKEEEEEEEKEKKEEGKEKEEKPKSKTAKDEAEEAGNKLLEIQNRMAAQQQKPPEQQPKTPAQQSQTPQPEAAPIEYTEEEKAYLQEFPEVEKIVEKRAKQIVSDLVNQGALVTPDQIAPVSETLVGTVTMLAQLYFQNELLERMPDALKIARSKDYQEWINKQSPAIQALNRSLNPEDALKVLNYYKEDMAKKRVEKHDAEAKKKAEKVNRVLSYTARSKPKKSKTVVEPEDEFAAAFEEATS